MVDDPRSRVEQFMRDNPGITLATMAEVLAVAGFGAVQKPPQTPALVRIGSGFVLIHTTPTTVKVDVVSAINHLMHALHAERTRIISERERRSAGMN